jgi:hypothetical protein
MTLLRALANLSLLPQPVKPKSLLACLIGPAEAVPLLQSIASMNCFPGL